MTDFLCPVCHYPLLKEDKSYHCMNNHCFDIARKGYVNLLQNNSSGRHGDDRLMVKARTDFLNRGYYDRLSNTIVSIVSQDFQPGSCIIDAGCGDGKYTADLENALSSFAPDIIGFDISKYALEALSHRSRTIRSAVSSTSAMPVKDHCADYVINLFSPFFPEEFHRILKPGGMLLRVIPLENHLWELKAAIYEKPYKNDVPLDLNIPGFTLSTRTDVCYRIEIGSSEDLISLFQMTPYYYKTASTDQQKLAMLDSLAVRLEFGVFTYTAI